MNDKRASDAATLAVLCTPEGVDLTGFATGVVVGYCQATGLDPEAVGRAMGQASQLADLIARADYLYDWLTLAAETGAAV